MSDRVIVCEVGPRDGLQMAKTMMATDAKIRWIQALAAAGLPEIEVGSFVPARVIPQMADTAEVVRAVQDLPALVVVLAPNLRGAQTAAASGVRRISVPVSVSEGHSRANTNRSTAAAIEEVAGIVTWLRSSGFTMEVEVALSTAFGCSIDGLIEEGRVVEVAAAVAEAGATTLTLADTVGYGNPAQVRRLVRAVRGAVGAKLAGLHLHDTMGLGLANALAGLEEGIRDFDSSLAGLGGCPYAPGASGNIVTEDLVFMLESLGMRTGVNLEALLAARALLAEGLPDEPRYGGVARAGLPAAWKPAA